MTLKDSVNATGQRAKGIMSGFTPGQIAVVSFGVVALVVTALLFSRWSAAPYSPLFSNLASADAAAIVQQLDASGVPYQLTDGGNTILVPQDKVYATRLAMSGQGLPASEQGGYALLDQQGITTSEFMQNVAYQRALEGELSNTIASIQGVEAATVHLAIPAQSVFTDEQQKTTASVLVTMRAGSQLDSQQVQSITNLVASSVPKLNVDNVTVADSSGALLTGGAGAAAAGATQAQATASVEEQLAAKAQSMIDRVVGLGNAAVRVNATLNFDQSTTRTQTYNTKAGVPPIKSDTTKETFSGTGSVPGGIVGANGSATTTGTGTNTYSKTTTKVDNSVGSVVTETTATPGQVQRLTVAVLLNQRAAGTIDPNQVKALVGNAVGLDVARGDTIVVQPMPFDTTAADAATAAAETAQADASKAALFDMIRKGGLVLLVLAVLVLAFLSSRRQRRSALDDEELAALGAPQWNGTVSRADGYAAGIPNPLEGQPRLAVEGPDENAIRVAQEREDVNELVARQPEEVAQLLRGWLADRRQ